MQDTNRGRRRRAWSAPQQPSILSPPWARIRVDIPDAVHTGVLKVLPGFVASELEVESKDGGVVYELEGVSEGSRYEVLVNGQGNVLRIDEEIDEDEDEDEGLERGSSRDGPSKEGDS